MFKKENFFVFALGGLLAAYAVLSAAVFITRGKWGKAVRHKLTVGAMVITFSALVSSGISVYSQDATVVPTVVPSISCYVPTISPAYSPVPSDTPGPTETTGTAAPLSTPLCYTTSPAETPEVTLVPTLEPGVTEEPTIAPDTDCTCDIGCSAVSAITVPFAQDGAGEYCWSTSALGSYINSWNTAVLEVNGIDYTNKYVSASQIQPVNGKYYIYYKGLYAYSHFEAK